MLKHKPENAVLYPKVCDTGMTCETQDLWLWVGCQVYACCRSVVKGLRNGALYTVQTVGDVTTLEDNGHSFSASEVSKYFRCSYAQTYASSQGATLDGIVELLDVDSPHFTTKALFMAMSRARDVHLLQIR